MQKIAIVFGVLILGIIIGIPIIIKLAFGPTSRTIEIEKPLGKLICHETYNADIAAVFYDVDFTLTSNSSETFDLGTLTFHKDDWKEKIELNQIGNWYYLKANYSTLAKINLIHKNSKKEVTFEFDPQELRSDSIWRTTNKELPAWPYGSSMIDSIWENHLFVEYDYRLGINPPFEFKRQTVKYSFDTLTGNLATIKAFETREK